MNENTKNALIRRNAEKLLLETMADTPVAVIQGARQTGKSTMIRMLSEKADIKYLTLDDPSILTVAAADPVAFVSQYPEGTLFFKIMRTVLSIMMLLKYQAWRTLTSWGLCSH